MALLQYVVTATWHLLSLLSCRDLFVKTRVSILSATIRGLQALHCWPWMLGSEIKNPSGDVWLQCHGNVWFCCGNVFSLRAMLGRFAIASSPNRTACCTTGSAFLRIPCSLTFPCWLCNWWIGRQDHEKLANTMRPGPVWRDFMPHIRF